MSNSNEIKNNRLELEENKMDLAGKKIVLGLTGGIACYKVAEFARAMIRQGASVQVVMTEGAKRFITPITMQALTGHPVFFDSWDDRLDNNMPHIDLTRDADLMVIAPCSANFMSKLANGLCDDLLSTLCLARPSTIPFMVAPAMNLEMWSKPATQRNLKQLKEDGVIIAGPASGFQACGEVGEGRMLEPNELLACVFAAFQEKVLANKKVLITAGPTFESIDPVRGITNRSSGKMGYAIAQAAYEAGAEVYLVSGPTALPTPYGVQRVDVMSAIDMQKAVMDVVKKYDVFISVAAVADWRVEKVADQKIKKTSKQKAPTLTFVENPDILAGVAKMKNAPYCVGFAAESENLREYAQEKRVKKGVPLLVGNLGPQTFGQDENALLLVDEKGMTEFAQANKLTLARDLVKEIAARLKS